MPEADRISMAAVLRADGVWRGEPAEPDPRPAWYLRLVSGVAAWFAALLMLPWLGLVVFDALDRERGAGYALGLACCLLALPLLRRPRGDFLPQLGTALSAAGMALYFVLALDGDGLGHAGLALLAAAMYAAGPVFTHRVLAAWTAAAALGMALAGAERFSGVSVAAALVTPVMAWTAAACWTVTRCDMPLAERRPALQPLAWAFTLAAPVGAWMLQDWGMPGDAQPAIVAARAACAVLPVAAWLAATGGTRPRAGARFRALGAVLLAGLGLAWWAAPGVAVGIAWLVAGFAAGRLAVLVAGVAATLAHLAIHYYQLHLSLLDKALWLAVAGGVLLAVALALHVRRGSAA